MFLLKIEFFYPSKRIDATRRQTASSGFVSMVHQPLE
jgi:hypothetical protein